MKPVKSIKDLGAYYENLEKTIDIKLAKNLDPSYAKLSEMVGAKDSKYMPHILSRLATVEQAKLVMELPATAEELAAKLNIKKEVVDKYLQELMEKGLIVITRRGPRLVRNPIQLHDTATNNNKYDKILGEDYFDLWAIYYLKEYQPHLVEYLAGGELAYSRMVPRWKSIKDLPDIMPCEDMREILKSQETLALLPCPCARVFREHRTDIPNEKCISVGRTAQYNLNRGVGKKITFEEAMDFLEKTDKLPLFHNLSNQRAVDVLICSCNVDHCEAVMPMMLQDKYKLTEGVVKSRFEANVDLSECKACKKCVAMCQFDAAQIKYYPELDKERAYIDTEKCMGCGSCVVNCPNGARAMKMVRSPDHIPDIGKLSY